MYFKLLSSNSELVFKEPKENDDEEREFSGEQQRSEMQSRSRRATQRENEVQKQIYKRRLHSKHS